MYFIKRITFSNRSYESSQIVASTNKTISIALKLLEDSAAAYVKEAIGTQVLFKIIEISNINQVSEPIIDTILVYKLASNPHCLHVFQRKTKVVPGTIYGQTTVLEFNQTHMFELEEYVVADPVVEPVFVKSNGILVPAAMTTSPYSELIAELVSSKRYLNRI